MKLRFKELREQHGYTCKQIANLFGISERAYRHYESNPKQSHIVRIIILANFYDVTIDYLLGLTDESQKKN